MTESKESAKHEDFFLNNEVNKMEDSLDRETKNREWKEEEKQRWNRKNEGSSPETKFKNKEEIFLKRGRNKK